MTSGTATPSSTVRIEGEMTIYRARELKEMLTAAIEPASSIELDLSQVTELDTSGVQVLMYSKQLAEHRQKTFRLIAQSAAIDEVFALLHLAAFFAAQPEAK